jgi:hypothetical protein
LSTKRGFFLVGVIWLLGHDTDQGLWLKQSCAALSFK